MSAKNSEQAADTKTDYVRTAMEDEVVREIREKNAGRAPAVKAAKDGILPGVVPNHPDEMTGVILLMKALGTTDVDFLRGLVGQVGEACANGGKVDEASVNFMLSNAKDIKPRDQLESMLVVQMSGVHMAIMRCFRQLAEAELLLQQESAERTLNRLARTFVTQLEALKRYRSGGEQTMTVQHLTVAEGGQAIVGNVTQDQRPAAGPAAPLAVTDAKMIPMPIIEAGDAVTLPARRRQNT